MTKKTAGKKKSAKKRVVRKKKELTLGELESSMEEMALTDFADNTRAQLHRLADKIHEATDKGVYVARDIADEVQRFAHDATELTKIKIELHHLKSEREKLYSLMGEQLRNLYRSGKLTNIRKRMKPDFDRVDKLELEIEEHEKRASALSISKNIA